MKKQKVCPSQTQQKDLKVIFQFPPKSIVDEIVKKEVKTIMASALKEQMGNKS